MENSWKFFENRDCRYFPCHSGLTDFNCLFCYCPLYLADPCPGTPKTLKRELAPLRAIDDNYPKYVLCKGECPYDDVDGIRIVDYDEWVKDPY